MGDDAGGVLAIASRRRLVGRMGVANSSWAGDSCRGFRGLEGVWALLRAGPARSIKARLDADGLDKLDLGVKNRLKRRGVMEGLALAFLVLGGFLGGDEGGGDRSPVRELDGLMAPRYFSEI